MKLRSVMTTLAAFGMVAMPAIASAAPANPAASLSIAKSVRTGTVSGKKNKLAGSGIIIAVVAAAAVVAGIVVVADSSSSN